MPLSVVQFAAISFLVSALVIADTFAILLAQRARDFALLRRVGATRRQVRRSVLAESLLVGHRPPRSTCSPVLASLIPAQRGTGISPLAALRPDTSVDVRCPAGRWRLAGAAGWASNAELEGGPSNREHVDVQLDMMTAAVVAMLGIGVVIALVGIGNTRGPSVLERVREHAGAPSARTHAKADARDARLRGGPAGHGGQACSAWPWARRTPGLGVEAAIGRSPTTSPWCSRPASSRWASWPQRRPDCSLRAPGAPGGPGGSRRGAHRPLTSCRTG